MSRVFLIIAILIGASAQSSLYAQSFGIHYGPRSFWAAPIGTNAISFQYEHLEAGISNISNVIRGFNIKTNTGLVSYSRYFDAFGKTANVIASLPYVRLEGSLDLPSQTVTAFDERGITDPYFQFYTPLVGGEARDFESFVRDEPGFIAGVFAAVRPPLGEYDDSKPASPGANRWEWRLGFPVQYITGLPTNQTSLEIVPAVYLFGDNDDAFGGGTSGQDPLYVFEAHVTHDLNRMFWGSLNVFYAYGGESSISGVNQDDKFDYVGGGATVGARLSRSVGANVTYGTSLRTKSSAEDGDWVRASITMTF